MGQRHQHSDAGTDGSAWLSTLIATFARTEQLKAVPCDAKTLSAAKAHLRRALLQARRVARRRQATLEFQH